MQTAVLGQRPEQELAETPRRAKPVRPVEPPRRLCEPGEREPVPRRDRLVVETRLRALLAGREQLRAERTVQLAADDEAAVLERLQQLLGHLSR